MSRVGLNGFAFVPAATGGSEIYFRILVSARQGADGEHEYILFVRSRVRDELPLADARFRVVAIAELLEAMGAGCPIVASKVTSIPEVAGDAVYFDALDVEEMSALIGHILADAELPDDLARR